MVIESKHCMLQIKNLGSLYVCDIPVCLHIIIIFRAQLNIVLENLFFFVSSF
jgi:hypothetical protein